MKIKVFVTAGVIALAITAVVGLLLVISCDFSPYTEIARGEAGAKRAVVIYVDTCWEVGRGVYYAVQDAERNITARRFFAVDSGTEQYSLTVVSTADGSLVGVFDPSQIDTVFILVDYETGESWPPSYDSKGISYLAAKQKALDILEQLRQEHPELVSPRELSN